MSLPIANTGLVIQHAPGSLISGGAFVVVTPPSTTTIAGTPVYGGPLQYTFSGGNAVDSGGSPVVDPGTVATTAPQIIPATALKVTVDGKPVMRQTDFGTMTAEGYKAPSPTPIPVTGDVIIISAGQTAVSAT